MPGERKVDPAQAARLKEMLANYERLKRVRESKDLKLHPIPMIRTEIVVDGKKQPFSFRYYQYIGIYHLLIMKRMLLGDGTGLGKTVQVLGALAYLWAKEPSNKVIVVTPKSAVWQWASEAEKFLDGVRPIVAGGSPTERKRAYEEFAQAPTGPNDPKVILLVNYSILVRDWDDGAFQPTDAKGRPDPKAPVVPGLFDRITSHIKDLVIIFDEATAFKNRKTKTWQVCRFLSDRSKRVYALTATLLKNNLIEGFSIYKVIIPGLFTNITAFMKAYCVTRDQRIKGSRRLIPIVVGYKNLDDFRKRIDPFFLGRPKHAVSNELPKLTTKEVICELGPDEMDKYREALSGVLELGDGEIKDYTETMAMASLIYCQEIANSPHLIKCDSSAKSAKESVLLDLLENELAGEKVIIYSRFEKFITRLTELLTEAGIKSVRITGEENEKKRHLSKEAFQSSESGVNVVFITNAGSEAINLQAASAMVFMDAPWSWGTYVQLLGRPVRIGSVHQNVTVYHLVAIRSGKTVKDRRTIDHHVLETLRSKKDFIDSIIGEAAVGALDFEKDKVSAKDMVARMKREAKAQ